MTAQSPITSHFEFDQDAFDTEARRQQVTQRIRKIAAYTVLSLFVLIAVGPVIYLISPAFRDSVSLFAYPPEWIPRNPTLDNFRFLLSNTSYVRWGINTLIYASGATLISVTTSTLAGYAFARLDFPGRRVLFFLILATLMVPVAAILAPTYLTVRTIGGWPIIGSFIDLDTYGGLILPSAVSPLGVFMIRAFGVLHVVVMSRLSVAVTGLVVAILITQFGN